MHLTCIALTFVWILQITDVGLPHTLLLVFIHGNQKKFFFIGQQCCT